MLNDQIVVVTGGAGLIGQEFIKAIVEQNAIAIIADIDEQNALSTKEKLCKDINTSNIDYIQMDITSKVSIATCIKTLHSKYNKIDALVNNAYPRNKNYGKDFFEVAYDDFTNNISMHTGGYFLASQQFANYFQQQGQGNIINIASIYGVVAPKFDLYSNTSMTMPVEYAAIKSSIIHLTKYMANYFKGMNIRVNCISPGGIFNHQEDSFLQAYKNECLNKGMLDVNDLKGTLIFLLSNMSHCINGQNIIVDDGFTL